MKKILFVTPHLSTGGLPQFVLKRIESLQKYNDQIEIFLIEYSQFSDTYVVQRNKIIDLLDKDHFFSLGKTTEVERKKEIIKLIKDLSIDIVHIEEIPESFESFNKIPTPILNELYSNKRTWKIVETCHNVWFDPKNKKFHPDAYSFVTPFHFQTFESESSYKELHVYPYENKVKKILNDLNFHNSNHRIPLSIKIKKRESLGLDISKTHILNVGLWTEGKNQKEGIEVARLLEKTNPNLHFHFIGNQAPNFKSYWEPIMKNLPSNVTVWGERNDVESFMVACDVLMFNSTWECNPLVLREAINYGMKIIARNLPQYVGMFDKYITPINETSIVDLSSKLLKLVNEETTYEVENQKDFGNELFNFYKKVIGLPITQNNQITSDYSVNQHFVVNPFFEILGESDSVFDVDFFDESENLIYSDKIQTNHWVKLYREYYTKWKIQVKENNVLIYENVLNLTNQRVYISFGSKSLGDTLAWLPYCEEFRKKHNCKLIVSTFMNYLFVDQYPQIEFSEPGKPVLNIIAQYRLGWFYNEDGLLNFNIHKNDVRKQPLQKTATDILGLNYEEIRPKLNLPKINKEKKVGIGFHSTAQAKYWNNPNGWQEVINYLTDLGYECVIYSKEGDGYMGNNYPNGVTVYKGGNLQEVIDDLSTCDFFIGLGSGLSWLAWACKLPLVLISGFSEEWAETKLDTYRVINESVCHGCFNSKRLDSGDWNWCPLHKNTDKMFECTKEISSNMVIDQIKKILNNKNPHN